MVSSALLNPLRHLRRPRGAMTKVAVSVWLATAGFATSAMSASILLDDFESGFNGMTGQIEATGPTTATPKPNTQAGLRINTAGTGGCDNFIGNSSALCGADTKKWAGENGAIVRYNVHFGQFSGVLFDVAAFSDNDPFDVHDGEKASEWGDYLRVSSLIGGMRTLLAEFTGVPLADRTPETAFGLASTDAGSVLGEGTFTSASFQTVKLFDLGPQVTGYGELLFEIRSTGSSEQIGLDNIRLAIVPLPSALSFSLLGFAAFAATARLRRRKNAQAA